MRIDVRDGFPWWRLIWWRDHDAELCSLCAARVPECPLTMFDEQEGMAAKFCDACAERWFGMRKQ
jgi:hypothetical protein